MKDDSVCFTGNHSERFLRKLGKQGKVISGLMAVKSHRETGEEMGLQMQLYKIPF